MEDDVIEYAGFWVRLWARLIDAIILSPFLIFGFIVFRNNLVITGFYWNYSIAFLTIFYEVYFFVKFGATIGKNKAHIKVIGMETDAITWWQSIIRNAPDYFLQMFNFFGGLSALHAINDFSGLNFFSLQKLLTQNRNPVFGLLTGLISLWFLADGIVFLCNKKKRSLHDIIAGTMVIKGETRISFK